MHPLQTPLLNELCNYFLTFGCNYALLSLLNPLPQLFTLAGLRLSALLFIAFEPVLERFCLDNKSTQAWGVLGIIEDTVAFIKSLHSATPQEITRISLTLLYTLVYPAIGLAGFIFNDHSAQLLKSGIDIALLYHFGQRLYENVQHQKPHTRCLSAHAEIIKNSSHLGMMLELIHDECAGISRLPGLKNLTKILGFISLPTVNKVLVAANATSIMHSSAVMIKNYHQAPAPQEHITLTPTK